MARPGSWQCFKNKKARRSEKTTEPW